MQHETSRNGALERIASFRAYADAQHAVHLLGDGEDFTVNSVAIVAGDEMIERFSKASKPAFRLARELARTFRAELIVFIAADTVVPAFGVGEGYVSPAVVLFRPLPLRRPLPLGRW